jgi:lipopolysaccharide biosynthesis regulator YciM
VIAPDWQRKRDRMARIECVLGVFWRKRGESEKARRMTASANGSTEVVLEKLFCFLQRE